MNVPFPPQEALLVEKIPVGPNIWYEPKWDGFRGVLENDGGALGLWSRNGRPLLRYFPELRPLGETMPPHSALDGEIVIEQEGRLEFDLMQLRLHPAESRIRKLSAETPARFIAFDVLLWNGEPLHGRPLAERRAFLERNVKGFELSEITRDVEKANMWLERLEVLGLDGIVAKRTDLPYMPGSRDAVQKVKHHRTIDCVIVGYRTSRSYLACIGRMGRLILWDIPPASARTSSHSCRSCCHRFWKRRARLRSSSRATSSGAFPVAGRVGRKDATCPGTRSVRRSSARSASTSSKGSASVTARGSSVSVPIRIRSNAPGISSTRGREAAIRR